MTAEQQQELQQGYKYGSSHEFRLRCYSILLSNQGKSLKMYRSNGWGGQTIMVFPELDMVIVFTGGNYASKPKLFKILRRYILPAVK